MNAVDSIIAKFISCAAACRGLPRLDNMTATAVAVANPAREEYKESGVVLGDLKQREAGSYVMKLGIGCCLPDSLQSVDSLACLGELDMVALASSAHRPSGTTAKRQAVKRQQATIYCC